jgi:hypothetical protein
MLNKTAAKCKVRDTAWEELTKLTEAVYESTGKDIMMCSTNKLPKQAIQGKDVLESMVVDGWSLAAQDTSLANNRVAAEEFVKHNHEQSTVLPLTGNGAIVVEYFCLHPQLHPAVQE